MVQAKAKVKRIKVPRSLGACADRLFVLRAEKSKHKRALEKLDGERLAIEERLIANLSKSDAEGVIGKVARVSISSRAVPTVKDWDKLYKFIKRTGDFSLLQRRVAGTTWDAYMEDRKKIPGVEAFNVIKVSVTKR